MAIKGSLREASLADVCQLLALGQKTGCLSITDRSRFGQIFFEKGRITYAHIVNRRDRLGDLLVRDGVLQPDQLARVLDRQDGEPDRRVGELLVDEKLLSTATLERYVRQQIDEAIYHLFTWARGSFFFEADERPHAADILVSINPESLLLEAARRVDEWSQIEKKIASFDLIFEVDRKRLRSADVELTSEQEQVLLLLDGSRSLAEIVEETGIVEFDLGKAVYGLLQAGFAQCVGRREEAEARRSKDAEIAERRNLGAAFYRTQMFEDAAREFERLLELNGDDLGARFHLGLIGVRQGRLRDAIRHFKTVLDLGGPRFGVYLNLAYVLRRIGRVEDALLVLQEAETLRPNSAAAALQRAVAQLELREVDAARASFDEYVRRLGKRRAPTAQYYHFAALARALARDLDGARTLAEEGLAAYPESVPLLLLAGAVHERSGDLDNAERCYRAAVDEDAGNARAQKNLGDVCYRRGAHAEALQHLRRAADLDPRIGDETYARIGNLLYRERELGGAVKYWNRALELNPGNVVVRNNLQIVAHATR
jgi:tetratricopeptide (TPR) repeat protein